MDRQKKQEFALAFAMIRQLAIFCGFWILFVLVSLPMPWLLAGVSALFPPSAELNFQIIGIGIILMALIGCFGMRPWRRWL